MEYIVNRVSEEALLEQLIEECGELVQASAKRLRIIRGENPTPVTLDDNIKNMVEELADVSLCARAVIHKLHINSKVMIIQDEKEERWTERLKEAERGKKMNKYFIQAKVCTQCDYRYQQVNVIIELSYEELDLNIIKRKLNELFKIDRGDDTFKVDSIIDMTRL